MTAPNELEAIELADIVAAAERIRDPVWCTPLVEVPGRRTQGRPLLLKAENLQAGGSFKVRGATNFIRQLSPDQRNRGVIAYSNGNHAFGVSLIATREGVPATIVMSTDAAAHKVQAVRDLGVEIVTSEGTSEERRELTESLADERDLALLPPYDHPAVLHGQGTIGVEILRQVSPAAIFVPVGGGGLVTAVGAAVKQTRSDVKIIAVEPELENDGWQSFHTGERVVLPRSSNSLADALRVQTLGTLTFPLLHTYVDDFITVSEEEIAAATLLVASDAHLVVEPAAGVAMAGAMAYDGDLGDGDAVVVIATGGNTTLDLYVRLQQEQT